VRAGQQTGRRHGRGERGYATAEAAVALPALLVVLAMAVGVVVSVGAQLRCVDAARVAARAAARGDSDADATKAARSVAPGATRIRFLRHGSQVEVQVSAQTRPFGHALRLFPAVQVDARAVAEVEGP
jgi:Flp pilus assembly protein TadG